MSTSSQTRPSRGDELELTVDSLAHGGNGVARHDGYVVFVAGAVPGDRVRAVVGKAKRAYAEARAIEVVEPSPDRVAPRADHPGAPWQVLPYERQLEIKAEQVREALERIGHLEGFEMDPIVPAVEQWRYRNKLEYSFGTGPDGELVCGFHAPGRWDEIVPMDDCLLASERVERGARRGARRGPRRRGCAAWDRREQRGLLRNLVVREGRRTGELQVRLVTSPGRDRRRLAGRRGRSATGLFWTQQDQLGETAQGGETTLISGSPQLREQLGGLEFLISPEAFFQTNTEMAEQLYARRRRVRAAARARARLRPLLRHRHDRPVARRAGARGRRRRDRRARRGRRDRERPPQRHRQRALLRRRHPARDARARRGGRAGPTSRSSIRRAPGSRRRSCAGSSRPQPSRIVYVSCNPTTLAPNAAQMVEAGYRLVRVRPVDMFPQTPHIECVALLEAGPDGVANPRARLGGLRPARVGSPERAGDGW